MKYDTRDFAENRTIKENFNVMGVGKFADPFLLQMSLNGKPVAGTDVRNLRQNTKQGIRVPTRRILPLSAEDMSKAKACDEMIQFEK
jgi:hypothetical protein